MAAARQSSPSGARPGADSAVDDLGELLLDVRGISVDYGLVDAVHAVDTADLRIHRGEVVGLAGESGSGKSTLAYSVTRLLRDPGMIVAGDAYYYEWPDDGSGSGQRMGSGVARRTDSPTRVVDLLGERRDAIGSVRWSQIAVVFQSALQALNPVMRVGGLLDDVLRAHDSSMSARARKARSEELLDMVGISPDRLRSYPHQLSGGMRQRVMIALSLALQPRLLIMDEPTTALDVVMQRQILRQLVDLRERLGFSVLFITHDLSLLIEIADTIAVMYAGRLVEKAPAEALFRAPRHPYTLGLTKSFPSLHGPKKPMTGIEGSPPDLRRLPPGCPFQPRCAWAMDICTEAMPPSFDVSEASGHREVSCYLHDGVHQPPAALDVVFLPDPRRAAAVHQGLRFRGCRGCARGERPMTTDAERHSNGEAPSRDRGRALLEAVDVTKHFRVGVGHFKRATVHAAENISVALYPGYVTAVVGESGSGKSTLARMLARTHRLTSGTLYLEGHEIDPKEKAGKDYRGMRAARAAGSVRVIEPGAQGPLHRGQAVAVAWCGRRRLGAERPGDAAQGFVASGRAVHRQIPARALRRPAATGFDRPRARGAAQGAAGR